MTREWVVFVAVVVVALVAGVAAYRSTSRRQCAWAEEMRAGQPDSWAEPEPLTVLSHVTADGEVVEYPIIRGESLVSLATTLGQIAALPEVAA